MFKELADLRNRGCRKSTFQWTQFCDERGGLSRKRMVRCRVALVPFKVSSYLERTGLGPPQDETVTALPPSAPSCGVKSDFESKESTVSELSQHLILEEPEGAGETS